MIWWSHRMCAQPAEFHVLLQRGDRRSDTARLRPLDMFLRRLLEILIAGRNARHWTDTFCTRVDVGNRRGRVVLLSAFTCTCISWWQYTSVRWENWSPLPGLARLNWHASPAVCWTLRMTQGLSVHSHTHLGLSHWWSDKVCTSKCYPCSKGCWADNRSTCCLTEQFISVPNKKSLLLNPSWYECGVACGCRRTLKMVDQTAGALSSIFIELHFIYFFCLHMPANSIVTPSPPAEKPQVGRNEIECT